MTNQSHIQTPEPRSTLTPDHRTQDPTHQNDAVNMNGSPNDRSSSAGSLCPVMDFGARSTIPARSSFEERQLALVQRGQLTISDAQRNVEGYRERREASVARLMGATS